MHGRLALAAAPLLAVLALASPSFAITVTPPSQSFVYGGQKATVTIGDVGGAQDVLIRLTRANGVVVDSWRTGPGSYTWGGKSIGTDTVLACPDATQDGVCDSPSASATVAWTQFPAIQSYKGPASNVARATFSNGVTVQFQQNAVCSASWTSRQVFLLLSWTDSGGPHRFTADYASSVSCVANAQGGYDFTLFGWGRIGTTAYPFKIIQRTQASGPPLEVRFGIGNAPAGLDWDFLNGTMDKGKLLYTAG